ncbi:MAG: CBS domain-containing protein [Bacteroidetes bacterium]|nr:CBS domain-containing protein [Bacteroidota bacterium]
MVWLSLGLFFYAILIIAEEVLIRLTPQEMDQYPAGSMAAYLSGQVRAALAALLYGRVLLKIAMSVGLVSIFTMPGVFHDAFLGISTAYSVDLVLLRLLLLVPGALLLSACIWLLHRLRFQEWVRSHAFYWLPRLGYLIRFLLAAFRPVLRKEQSSHSGGIENAIEDAESAQPKNATNGEKRELELLKSIVQFGDTMVKQVMQPRSKVVGVDFRTDFASLLEMVRAAEFSRIPVYDEDLDNVTGILYVKDLIAHLDKPANFEWQGLIRTNLLFAPESKRCQELLEEFKIQKIHMAMVVDEYGGCAGIVTMEDLLEEVIGDIRDEFDVEMDIRYRKLDAHNYIFEGQTLLNDVIRVTGLPSGAFDELRNTAETLAGLALTLCGDIPKAGAELAWDPYLFTILAANNRRIEQIKLTIP